MHPDLPFILLLGRPGCGKSAVYKMLVDKFRENGIARTFERMDDFPILKELLDRDTEFKRHIRKDGGFAVTDWSIIDEVLREIGSRVFQGRAEGKIIFVEFARADYQSALKNFSSEFIAGAVVLYIKASFEMCLSRNEERFRRSREKNLDDHIVPPDLMKSYYKDDDLEKIIDAKGEAGLARALPFRSFVLDNNVQGLDLLSARLDRFIVFYRETLASRGIGKT